MFFETIATVWTAMSSLEGQAAGELLQKMTAGRMTLLIADHMEDTLENIRKYQPGVSEDDRNR